MYHAQLELAPITHKGKSKDETKKDCKEKKNAARSHFTLFFYYY
jgi:hypothetical protein